MLFVAVMLATFFIMEGITWLTHKYVMHGFLWVLHEDHHQPTGHVLEKNDAFFLIFAIPSMACIFYGTIMGGPLWVAAIGAGIAMYGFAYFIFCFGKGFAHLQANKLRKPFFILIYCNRHFAHLRTAFFYGKFAPGFKGLLRYIQIRKGI